MKLMVLVDLAQLKGITKFQDAMQLAAEITAPNPREMDELRREVRMFSLTDSDIIQEVKKKIQARRNERSDGYIIQ